MFIFSKYIITKERENCLELIEKNSVRIFLGLFFLLFGFIILNNTISFAVGKVSLIIFSMYVVSLCFILAGSFRLCMRASIHIDKKKKILTYNSGLKNIVFRPLKINFDQIINITIDTEYTGEHWFPSYQVIKISLVDNKTVTLDKSANDLYTNELLVKISNAIGCEMFINS